MNTRGVNVEHQFAERLLNDLDLEPIIVKAVDAEEGHGWTIPFALAIAEEYRKYLVLCLENQDFPVVPSSFVDDFWHLHILDTQKYQADCEEYLGYFLHHFPYFGMRGDEDASNLLRAWHATRDLYRGRFGELPEQYWPISNRCPNCGQRCRGKGPAAIKEMRPRLASMTLQGY